MTNKRVYEIAKEMNKSSKEIVDKAKSLGFNVSNHMAVISESQERALRQALRNTPAPKKDTGAKPGTPAGKPADKQFQHKKIIRISKIAKIKAQRLLQEIADRKANKLLINLERKALHKIKDHSPIRRLVHKTNPQQIMLAIPIIRRLLNQRHQIVKNKATTKTVQRHVKIQTKAVIRAGVIKTVIVTTKKAVKVNTNRRKTNRLFQRVNSVNYQKC